MKRVSIQLIQTENVIALSELDKRRITLRKILDNWFMVVLICVLFFTGKVIIEQMAMFARAVG